MTFIIAIQLEDSVIVAADNRNAVINDDGTIDSCEDETSKLTLWKNGIITGSGELTVIHRAIEFFTKIGQSKIQELSKCLQISRLLRELEAEHPQIQTTKLLYSSCSDTGVQLYWLEPDGSGEYETHQCQNNEIILWVFNSDIGCIAEQLKNLYASLKPHQSFHQTIDWINHYLFQIRSIYQEQALHDSMMSPSFDFFCQTKDEYITGHIPNTQTSFLEITPVPSGTTI